MFLHFGRFFTVQNITGQPEHTEGEQNAEIRGQMSNSLEDRHENQGAYAHKKHKGLFELRAIGSAVFHSVRRHNISLEEKRCQEKRDQQTEHGRDPEALHDIGCSDLSADPEHGGGNIADWGPGTACIGSNDNNAREEHALLMVFKQAFHQSYHNNSRCHIVEYGRKVKGDKAYDPEQARKLCGLNARSDDLETAVGVGHLDDCHCTDQKKDDGRGFGQLFRELVAYAFGTQRTGEGV